MKISLKTIFIFFLTPFFCLWLSACGPQYHLTDLVSVDEKIYASPAGKLDRVFLLVHRMDSSMPEELISSIYASIKYRLTKNGAEVDGIMLTGLEKDINSHIRQIEQFSPDVILVISQGKFPEGVKISPTNCHLEIGLASYPAEQPLWSAKLGSRILSKQKEKLRRLSGLIVDEILTRLTQRNLLPGSERHIVFGNASPKNPLITPPDTYTSCEI